MRFIDLSIEPDNGSTVDFVTPVILQPAGKSFAFTIRGTGSTSREAVVEGSRTRNLNLIEGR